MASYETQSKQAEPETRRNEPVAVALTQEATSEQSNPLNRLFVGAPGDKPINHASQFLSSPTFSHAANSGARVIALKRAQQTQGNRFVQRAASTIQRKPTAQPLIQRQCDCGSTCAKCSAPAIASGGGISDVEREIYFGAGGYSPKLAEAVAMKRTDNLIVSPPDDPTEHEADHVAEAATQSRGLDSSKLGKDAAGVIGPARVPAAQTSGVTDSGSPLTDNIREKVEPLLGVDLSSVRVHTSGRANEAASSLHAKAFTHSNHIWLGPQQSPDDLGLMAHEATHVVQQSATPDNSPSLQRAPADHQHPEDGGAVRARMQARIREEVDDSDMEEAPPAETAPPDASEKARNSAEIDRGELREKKGELQPEAKPDVDRPAAEKPRVEKAATVTEKEAETPGEPLVEEKEGAAAKEGAEGEEKKKGEAMGEAEQAAALADQAFEAAASQPEPEAAMPVTPPEPVTPVDSEGAPLEDDPETEMQVADLADRAQSLREQGHLLRMQATQERANAQVLRGNIELVKGGVTQAETGVTKSLDHLEFRQQLVDQADQARAVSEEKAQMVAEQAPEFSNKADEGKEESGPMASEAGELASENESNVPDDEDAAEDAREQGGKMNQAGADIATTDDAITQTQVKAESLGEDAARAKELNAQTQEKITAMQETVAQSGERLSEMKEQATQARGSVTALESQPRRMTAQAITLDEQSAALIQASFDIESQLKQAQVSYDQGMKSVPAIKQPAPSEGSQEIETEGMEQTAGLPEGENQLVQLALEDNAPTQEETPDVAPVEAPVEASAETSGDNQPGNLDLGTEPLPDETTQETGGTPEMAAEQAAPDVEGYEGRINLNLGHAFEEELSAEQREQARLAEQGRRRAQVEQINQMANGKFEELSARQKMGIALELMRQNLFGSLSKIQWPGWGNLALSLIDPRSSLKGVVSGFSMMLSGGANLLSAEQWRKDPLGNLLKSAADIATGLTIILGSITALAGVIIAAMTALTIISFGTLAWMTGPVIAFCATVLTTVGGWTIAVGQVALILQALVFIKNLIDAACADTAEELQSEADQMTEDVSSAGNVLMQMGMAKLGQMGGKAALGKIKAAGGGVRAAAGTGAKFGAGVKALPGAVVKGAKALPGAAVKGAKALPGAVVKGAKALPGVISRGAGKVVTGGGGLARRGLQSAKQGVKALPGRIVSGVKALPGQIISAPGQIYRGAKSLPGRLKQQIKQEFTRDIIVGEGIPKGSGIKGLKAVVAEVKAAVNSKVLIQEIAPGMAKVIVTRADGTVQEIHLEAGAGGNWKVIGEVVDPNVTKQFNPVACGPACAEMMLREQGLVVSQEKLAELAGGPLTFADTLVLSLNEAAAGRANVIWRSGQAELNQLKILNSTGPWSAMMWPGNKIGHWVVVDGFDAAGRLMIRDPFHGTRYLMQPGEFDKYWTGIVVFGVKK